MRMKGNLYFYIEKYPEYKDIILFYEKVCSLQEKSKPEIYGIEKKVQELESKKKNKEYPLINRSDFIVDIVSSMKLFKTLLEECRDANDLLNRNICVLEEVLLNKDINLSYLIENHSNDSYLEFISNEHGIDLQILKFLIFTSIYPSIQINVDKFKNLIDFREFLKGYCPICGSLPFISALKDEGRRYLSCSYCYFEWLTERLKCPFCENNDHNSLHYFFEEGDEIRRIDLCEQCKHYIKTIDLRKLSYQMDITVENIISLHLDLIALEKGYKKPTSSFWII